MKEEFSKDDVWITDHAHNGKETSYVRRIWIFFC
jgi:hypothetical protein